MDEKDFEFNGCTTHDGLSDYYFKVTGKSCDILTDRYMEQSMIEITEVVYSPDDGACGVEKLFPFNMYVEVVKDDELKDILSKKITDDANAKWDVIIPG